VHQWHAEFVFQRGQLLRQRGLRHADDLGGAGQAAVVDDGHKIAHGADVHGFSRGCMGDAPGVQAIDSTYGAFGNPYFTGRQAGRLAALRYLPKTLPCPDPSKASPSFRSSRPSPRRSAPVNWPISARVIKIERPGPAISRVPMTAACAAVVALRLDQPFEGKPDARRQGARRRPVLDALLEKTDVLVQNLAPGASTRLGLDYETLSKRFRA
jgi:hypothetical protein